MHSVAKKSVAIASALGLAGISTLFLGTASASASTPTCGAGGTLLSDNATCEETFRSGTNTFTPTVHMTHLQVLLVAGGGSGVSGTTSYGPGGGGGGQVEVVDFDGTTAPLSITVGDVDQPTTVTPNGGAVVTAAAGDDADGGGGATSGSGNPGATATVTDPLGAGGGAALSPTDNYNGGEGFAASAAPVVSPAGATVTPSVALFSGDNSCYGGGGAVGDSREQGVGFCGAGEPNGDGSAVDAPQAFSGSGGGGIVTTGGTVTNDGASGVAVVRWNASPGVTLSFSSSRGGAPSAETVIVGDAPTKPADPVVAGYVFKGWYTDAALTTPANFSDPITADTTFFAAFTPVLAATGGTLNPFEIPLGVGGLGLGLALLVVGRRSRRTV